MGRGSRLRTTALSTTSAVAIFGAASAFAQTTELQTTEVQTTEAQTVDTQANQPGSATVSNGTSTSTTSVASGPATSTTLNPAASPLTALPSSSTRGSTAAATGTGQITGITSTVPQTPSVQNLANTPFAGVLSFTTGAEYNTNRDLVANPIADTFNLYEQFGLGLRSQNATDVFDLQGSVKLEYENLIGTGTTTLKFTEPNIVFAYSKDTGNSFLSLRGDYWQGDVSNAYNIDPTNPALLIPDTGTLFRTNTVFDFQTGINDPLGFFTSIAYDTLAYSNTSNFRLRNTTTWDATAGVNFRFSQRTQGYASFNRVDFAESNNTREIVTDVYETGISHELPRAMTLYATLGYQDQDRSIRNFTGNISGSYGNLDFVQNVNNGSYFGGVGFDNTQIVDKTSLTFGRSLALPDGSLSASLTLSNAERIGLEYFGSINYVHQVSTGALNFDLSRDLTLDQNYRNIIYTSFSVGYQQQINTASAFDVTFDYSRSEGELIALIPTEDRATLTASYSHSVTPEWFMNVGYEHQLYESTVSSRNASSDRVFLTMTRDVRFGF